ncbi:MAG: hypothetical protein HOP28_02175 [Gemmatimonadales bacterium]|nr:hypothetical protein [Gemmatimonadales bacterium]
MAATVWTFSQAHPSTEPGHTVMLGRLEEHLTRAEAIAAREHEGRVSAKVARSRRAELRRVVHFQLLRYLVAIGEIAAKTQTDLEQLTLALFQAC